MTEGHSLLHTVWPTCPCFGQILWNQGEWSEYEGRFRPEGYAGGPYDKVAWAAWLNEHPEPKEWTYKDYYVHRLIERTRRAPKGEGPVFWDFRWSISPRKGRRPLLSLWTLDLTED